MGAADKIENKVIVKSVFDKTYLKNWFFTVALKAFVDLTIGFLLIFTFVGIGYLLGSISFFSEAKLLSDIVKKSSFVLAYCYLVAIFVSTSMRIYILMRSDLAISKMTNIREEKSMENKTEAKK